ncbi:MAG: hypothetical protein C0478_05280 [Planctomyces sp.]|nr:hypothetical protein [Planctomyces sp.]
MHAYANLADDFYANLNLHTEMPLPSGRETILGFFERIQKAFPTMRNFHSREGKDYILEEDKDQDHQRWIAVENKRISSGFINPDSLEQAAGQHELMLQLAPYMLSVSPLDCEALDYMLGFDFAYRGNHDALLAEVLGPGPALENLLAIPGSQPLSYEPNITIALDESCRRQARLSVETRTSAYQVRKGEFGEDHISVYFTVRQYGSLDPSSNYELTFKQLKNVSEELMERCVIEQILKPIQQAIDAR